MLGGLYIVRKRLTRGDVLRFMDAAAPGLLVAQSIGRIGNYFNQELFGKPSTLPWALKISPDAPRRPATRSSPRSSPRSCTRSSGTCAWPGS